MRRAVFSILVDNSSGVLSRVAGLFSRRGYNIDSLTVGETLDPKLSRMTITVTGDDDILEQIEKQLAKLIDVKEIVELPHDESVCRELVLIKVLCTREERQQITTMADIYRANIVDVAKNSLIISLTGNRQSAPAAHQDPSPDKKNRTAAEVDVLLRLFCFVCAPPALLFTQRCIIADYIQFSWHFPYICTGCIENLPPFSSLFGLLLVDNE